MGQDHSTSIWRIHGLSIPPNLAVLTLIEVFIPTILVNQGDTPLPIAGWAFISSSHNYLETKPSDNGEKERKEKETKARTVEALECQNKRRYTNRH